MLSPEGVAPGTMYARKSGPQKRRRNPGRQLAASGHTDETHKVSSTGNRRMGAGCFPSVQTLTGACAACSVAAPARQIVSPCPPPLPSPLLSRLGSLGVFGLFAACSWGAADPSSLATRSGTNCRGPGTGDCIRSSTGRGASAVRWGRRKIPSRVETTT